MRFLRDLYFGAVSVSYTRRCHRSCRPAGSVSRGYGKDLGIYGLDDYTRIKHVAHAL